MFLNFIIVLPFGIYFMKKIYKGEFMKTDLKQKTITYGRIIDAKKVAEILGISRSTVYKMVRCKLISYIEYPDAIRFYENEVYDYLDKHRIEAHKSFKSPSLE